MSSFPVVRVDDSELMWTRLHRAAAHFPSWKFYYLLDEKMDPYRPKAPVSHGVKLTAVFNPSVYEVAENPYDDVPVFVEAGPGPNNVLYCGQYSQPRRPDRLGFDTQCERVPQPLRRAWATVLADPARPQWVTNELAKYPGVVSRGAVVGGEELVDAEKQGNTVEEILAAFKRVSDVLFVYFPFRGTDNRGFAE